MATVLATTVVNDGNNTAIHSGVLTLEATGNGTTGPFTFAHVLIDGVTGTTIATIKKANTTAVAGDTGLVVGIHPQSNAVVASGTVTAVVSGTTFISGGTVTSVISGTSFISGGNLTAVVSGTTVISAGAMTATINQAGAALSSTNGIFANLLLNGTTISTSNALPVLLNTTNLNPNGQTTMANSSPVVIASDQSSIPVAGDVANDAADSGNPVKMGFKASTSIAAVTLVADGDRVNGYAGSDGVQIIRPHGSLEDIATGNATTNGTAAISCINAAGAGVKVYLMSVVLCNTGTTAVTVDIRDGTTSTKSTLPLPAGSGCIYNPPIPIPGTANQTWTFVPSAISTTVTCSMVGFKSKV